MSHHKGAKSTKKKEDRGSRIEDRITDPRSHAPRGNAFLGRSAPKHASLSDKLLPSATRSVAAMRSHAERGNDGVLRIKLPLFCFLCVLCAFVVNLKASPAAADKDSGEWGTIKGQIVWGGNSIPEPKPLNVNKDQEHCLSKGPILSEDWVINKSNKGMRWVIVWLAPEPKSKKTLPIHPSVQEIKVKEVEIDQPCCAFVPHALGMREGQVLVAKNSAPKTTHNVHWVGNPLTNPGGNQSVPAGKSYRIKGLKADKLPLLIKCDIHGWMNARVGVFDHPYFAVTDENGNFEIKLAPAGNWRLKAYKDSWRGGADGRDGEKITVKGGEITDLGKLEFPPAE